MFTLFAYTHMSKISMQVAQKPVKYFVSLDYVNEIKKKKKKKNDDQSI